MIYQQLRLKSNPFEISKLNLLLSSTCNTKKGTIMNGKGVFSNEILSCNIEFIVHASIHSCDVMT